MGALKVSKGGRRSGEDGIGGGYRVEGMGERV